MEEIFSLQKVYDEKHKLNKDLPGSKRVDVLSKHRNEGSQDQSKTDGFIRHENDRLKTRNSISMFSASKTNEFFNSTMENFKLKAKNSRNNKESHRSEEKHQSEILIILKLFLF